jgi:hypothetical protein
MPDSTLPPPETRARLGEHWLVRLAGAYRVCSWLGHRREIYAAGLYMDRRGRWRTRYHHRCTRCGTSDGAEVFFPGVFEGWRYYSPRCIWWRGREGAKAWWRQTCEDCGEPTVRFGRRVGNHENCDVIPF